MEKVRNYLKQTPAIEELKVLKGHIRPHQDHTGPTVEFLHNKGQI
jgi:hypothetical protein